MFCLVQNTCNQHEEWQKSGEVISARLITFKYKDNQAGYESNTINEVHLRNLL